MEIVKAGRQGKDTKDGAPGKRGVDRRTSRRERQAAREIREKERERASKEEKGEREREKQ